MKRPPGIWFLLSAGVLWLSGQDVYGIRATALFGRSTTTTTPPGPVANVTDGLETEVVTESSTESSSNTTKPALTGIPQIDYLYDPNLPKELNGYNLSEYPFYERVPDPEEIDFKCDGLHDGFYASIPFKCQVYHHCLFGTRYDFLCANYTAFDQKTFICQFVSDVDCVGSKKFWHRNDALYQAASTTTSKPLNIYTPPPQANPVLNPANNGGQRAGGKRRRPLQRRPQYDYYDYADYDDDYYEDRPRSRRRRPRPRPLYDDEYEDEYEDEAYERRNRRPYNRRGSSDRRRNKNRNKNRDSLPEEETDSHNDKKKYSDEEEDYRPSERRKPNREEDFEDDRPNNRRKPNRNGNLDESRSNGKRKPQSRDEYDEDRPRKPSHDSSYEDQKAEKRKPTRDEDFVHDYDSRSSRPRKSSRRPPVDEDYEDDLPRNEDRRATRPKNKENSDYEKPEENKAIIIPTTGTIYDRPRVAPRIKPPVPRNEADKYAYKTISKTTSTSPIDDEYYDYEEELPSKASKSTKTETDPIKPKSSETKERKHVPEASRSRTKTNLEDADDALILTPKTKPKFEMVRNKDRFRSRPNIKTTEQPVQEEDQSQREHIGHRTKTSSSERNNKDRIISSKFQDSEYYDEDYDIIKTREEPKISSAEVPRKKWKPNTTSRQTTTTSTTSTTTTTPRATTRSTTTLRTSIASEPQRERPEQIVRIVKRPFLPSRGGNPYLSRGLQPVGTKAQKSEIMKHQSSSDIQQTPKETNQDAPSTYKPNMDAGIYSENFRGKTKYGEESEQSPSAIIRGNQGQKFDEPVEDQLSRKPHVKPKFSEPISDNDDDFKPMKRPQHILRPQFDGTAYNGPRTTQKPKVPERNPLDINENEYDVTLNDALNPTLPNLPVRASYQSEFSPANDYTFSAFQRPRYVLEPIISPANTEYVYQPKQPVVRQRLEAVPQTYNTREQYVSSSNDYKSYYTPVVRGNAKRGVTQVQTHPFYTTNY